MSATSRARDGLDNWRMFGTESLNIRRHVPDMSYVQPAPLKRPTLLRRIASALAILSPRPLCTLVDSPLPELREVGAEWRLRQLARLG